ncbi:MAG: DUF4388 domain-containing protein [Deltaproteobacteria bacterium]|nr:DUF4388 domain-containing protein [Deltaproteobacteria bacterium]
MRGRIEDFGLADLLQIILAGQRSGRLTCQGHDDEIVVLFRQSWIVSAERPQRPNAAALASRLVRAGIINQAQFGEILKERAETDEAVGEILERKGWVDIDTLSRFATLLAADTVFDLFTWRSGVYAFSDEEIAHEDRWVRPISADFVLVNGIRFVEEWPFIRARVPSYRLLVADRLPLPPPKEELFDPFGMPQPEDEGTIELGADERIVHEICEPGVNVRTIIDRSPLGRLDTFRRLSNLVEGGYISLRERSGRR